MSIAVIVYECRPPYGRGKWALIPFHSDICYKNEQEIVLSRSALRTIDYAIVAEARGTLHLSSCPLSPFVPLFLGFSINSIQANLR